jgi:hypothetical protein
MTICSVKTRIRAYFDREKSQSCKRAPVAPGILVTRPIATTDDAERVVADTVAA